MRLLLLVAVLLISFTVSAQVVDVSGGQVRVDGKLVLGINDCFNSIPVDGGLGFDGGCRRAAGDCDGPDGVGEKFAPLVVYSKAYRDAGFNTFRVSRGGACNPADPEVLIPYMRQLKLDGWAVWLSLYDVNDAIFGTEFTRPLTPAESAIVTKNLVQRFSPYVDIWEVSNEARPSVDWVLAVTDAIRANDPLHRPISISWNDASYASFVDLNSPHWYSADPDIPEALHNSMSLEFQKMPSKPIVYGEIGNSGQNWSKKNVSRVHDFIVTAFSEGVGLIFWNTSNSRDYQAEAANIYLGPEERAEVQRLLGIVPTPPPRHLPSPVPQVPRRKPCWLTPGMCQ